MRHVGRLRSPRQPSCADAWPTGNPTSRTAATNASVSRTIRGQAVTQWYKPMSNNAIAATSVPGLTSTWSSPRWVAQRAKHPADRIRYTMAGIRRRRMSGKVY